MYWATAAFLIYHSQHTKTLMRKKDSLSKITHAGFACLFYFALAQLERQAEVFSSSLRACFSYRNKTVSFTQNWSDNQFICENYEIDIAEKYSLDFNGR